MFIDECTGYGLHGLLAQGAAFNLLEQGPGSYAGNGFVGRGNDSSQDNTFFGKPLLIETSQGSP